MDVLKTDMVFPVQISNFFASFENAGGEEIKLLPPLSINLSSSEAGPGQLGWSPDFISEASNLVKGKNLYPL